MMSGNTKIGNVSGMTTRPKGARRNDSIKQRDKSRDVSPNVEAKRIQKETGGYKRSARKTEKK